MTTSLIDADSLLALDVGSVNTRAALFDVVDGRYRFLAAGRAQTTAYAPFNDISEGIRRALDHLQRVTGRTLVDSNEQLIMPSGTGGGVDTIAATLSVGEPLKVVIVGLLEGVSVESARNLAATTYSRVVETLSMNDRRKQDERIDSILRLRPDLILAAGGTEGGASQSVLKLLEAVGLANYLLPDAQRPEILYAGNRALKKEVETTLKTVGSVHVAPNVRPTLEVERLDAAQTHLGGIFRDLRSRQIGGIHELDGWAGGGLLPTATAFGRIIRFLSVIYEATKGVLGVDVGASATTLATAFEGELNLGVYPQYGLGSRLAGFLNHTSAEEISRWLPVDVPISYLREFLYNKSLYPSSLPATPEDVAIEQAVARQAMQLAVRNEMSRMPEDRLRYGRGLLPWFEPIVASGGVLTGAPNLGQAMMMLLDGLQPTGVTTMVLDQNHLSPSLGAAAAVNSILVVQVLESSTFLNLGTVISPISSVSPGTPILRVRITQENGKESNLEIKQGALGVIPVPMGQPVRLHLQPLHRADVGMGRPGQGGSLRVAGGALGLVVDARGRPLRLPKDPGRRRELIKKWMWTLGAAS
jgi:hypothetical protein